MMQSLMVFVLMMAPIVGILFLVLILLSPPGVMERQQEYLVNLPRRIRRFLTQ
jgi:uncharacterized membrane protein (Fun14 family)